MYAYCSNNSVRYIDPTGMSISPIYDEEGKLIGTDDEGLQGEAIIMNKSNFKQGMSHEEALSHSLGIMDWQMKKRALTTWRVIQVLKTDRIMMDI